MDNFIVSARKYRPTTFNSVVGQQALTTTLKNAIRSNHLAHAYLFCGPRGVGKTTCARIFAKTINCLNLTSEGEACNACESCVAFNDQRSYNIHELDAASNNSVDDIRSLIDQVRIPPQIGKFSVYIVDEVHMLSPGAFNAFLKTLEEPPSHAMFILATTEKHKIIPTILSRCQIYDFNRITVADTVSHLQYVADKEHVTVDVNGLSVIAQKSDGGMRDALSIFDQLVSFCGSNITYQGVIDNLNVLDYEFYFKLVDAFLVGDVSTSLLILNDVLNKGFDAHHFVTGLSAHLRDVLVSKDEKTLELLEVGFDIRTRYLQQAQKCSPEFLFQALKLSNDCDLDYRLSKNKRLLVELTLIRLSQLNDEKKKANINYETPQAIQKIEIASEPSTENTYQKAEKPIEIATQVANAEPKPKEAVVPVANRPESISISRNKVSGNITAQAISKNDEIVLNVNSEFTEEEFSRTWQKFENTLADEKKISFQNLNAPTKKTDLQYEIVVNNIMQENEIKKLLGDILIFMRSNLNNSSISIYTKIAEESEMQKSLSPEQRYLEMVSKNPNLEEFRKTLQLEID